MANNYRTSDFYKVVNAIINQLNQGNEVAFVKNNTEKGVWGRPTDTEELRIQLLADYCDANELYVDEGDDGFEDLMSEWATHESFDSGEDFWELIGTKVSDDMQVQISNGSYVTSSYQLRDMICDECGYKAGEITTGTNGYPSGLRGCVLIGEEDLTYDDINKVAERYGVEVVSLHRRDGWQLWECEGTAWGLYDYLDYMADRNDNLHTWNSYKEYAEELREYAAGDDMDEELKQEFLDAADKVEGWELGENEFLFASQGFPYLTEEYLEKADRMVDHFSYDTHNYTLALDCMIEK